VKARDRKAEGEGQRSESGKRKSKVESEGGKRSEDGKMRKRDDEERETEGGKRKTEDGRLTTSKLRKTGGVERKEEGKRRTEDERGGLKTELLRRGSPSKCGVDSFGLNSLFKRRQTCLTSDCEPDLRWSWTSTLRDDKREEEDGVRSGRRRRDE